MSVVVDVEDIAPPVNTEKETTLERLFYITFNIMYCIILYRDK